MKNPIIEGIETAIAAHKEELKKYESMLAIYNSGPNAQNYNSRRDGQLRRHAEAAIAGKRGPKHGVKRGPYKTTSRIESPDWKVEIPKALTTSGEPLTTREIIDAIKPGYYGKTKRVLHARCGAIISIYKKEKRIIREAGLKNGFQSYLVQ